MINSLFINKNAGFWVGIVEDRQDPEQLGRVRVRVIGFHPENKADVPTESLPWATVLLPVTSSPQTAPVGLVEGSTVCGFFLDGTSAQQPMVIGIISGKNVKATGI